jgi:hypothetical protein
MKQRTIDIMSILTIIPIGILVSNYVINKFGNINQISVMILTIVLSTLLYLFLLIICINVGNLSKSVYSKINGFSFFPIILYPFYFYKSSKKDKLKIYLIFDWSSAFRDLFAFDFIEKISNRKIDEFTIRFYVTSLKIRTYSKIIFCLFLGGGSLFIFKNIMVCCFLFFMSLLFLMISMLNTEYYHGDLYKCKNANNGDLIVYLAKEICIYSFEKHNFYEQFEKWLLENKEIKYNNFIFTTIKHMLVENCTSKGQGLSVQIINYINDNIICYEKIKIGLFDESWETVKAFILYNIKTENSLNKIFVRDELRMFKMKWGVYLNKFYDMMDYYIGLCEDDIEIKNKKYPLIISNDRFCCIAPLYKKRVLLMEKLNNYFKA